MRRVGPPTPGRHFRLLAPTVGAGLGWWRRLNLLGFVGAAGVAASVVTMALAAWLASGFGGSGALAQQVAAGSPPAATTAGSSVTLTWPASTLIPSGDPVDGYTVRRFDPDGAPQTVGEGCAGIVAGLGCTEVDVPDGTWGYSVEPVIGNWSGPPSTRTEVVVAAPTVTAIDPGSRGQGSVAQVLTLTGTALQPGVEPSFSGTGVTVVDVEFVSSTELSVTVSVAPGAAPGARDVTVVNPDGGSGVCTGCFTVTIGPTVADVDPGSRGQGAAGQVLAVTGTSFVSGAAVSFSGAGITVLDVGFVSSTELSVTVSVASGAAPGARDVTVANPDGGTGVCGGCFTVTAGPEVTDVVPGSRGQGAAGQVLAVTGSSFVSGAAVSFSGSGITVLDVGFVSSTELSVTVSVASGAAPGARDVTVVNSDGGTGVCAECFTVTAGPEVTSLQPEVRGQGSTAEVTLTGSGFVSGGSVTFSGAGVTVNGVTWVSGTELVVDVSVASGAATGLRDVAVTNPDGGFGSCSGCFTVAPSPTVTSMTPDTRGQGAVAQAVTVTGTGFVDGATVVFSGAGITVDGVTFVSATQLTATISIAPGAAVGTRNVTVTNSIGGSGTCTGCFTVVTGPTLTSASPPVRGQGFSGSIELTGTNFAPGATASFSGTGIAVGAVTYVSPTQLTATVTVAPDAATGPRNVTVTNPDGGTGGCSGCFTVAIGPTVISSTPSSRGQGAANQNLTVAGTNFANGTTVAFSGTGITVDTVTFVSATQLTVNVSVAGGAVTGARSITATNPNGGTGVCSACFTVNPAPVASLLNPALQLRLTTINTTVTGTGFVSGTTVVFSGTGATVNSVTFVSPTQLTVNVTISLLAPLGNRNVTVINPDGGTSTCVACYLVV